MGISEDIKQGSFRNNRLKAHINILYSYNWLRDKINPIFKKHGLLEQHFNVLKIVKGSHPKKVSPGYIIEVMLDKKRDLTRLVDKLVKLGLLVRNTNSVNRRKVEIGITEEGMELVQRIDADLIQAEETLMNLDEEEAGQLSDLLDKMRKQ